MGYPALSFAPLRLLNGSWQCNGKDVFEERDATASTLCPQEARLFVLHPRTVEFVAHHMHGCGLPVRDRPFRLEVEHVLISEELSEMDGIQ